MLSLRRSCASRRSFSSRDSLAETIWLSGTGTFFFDFSTTVPLATPDDCTFLGGLVELVMRLLLLFAPRLPLTVSSLHGLFCCLNALEAATGKPVTTCDAEPRA